MKGALLLIFVLILSGCVYDQVESEICENAENCSSTCIELENGDCCVGNSCDCTCHFRSVFIYQDEFCEEGYEAKFLGCDKDCAPQIECAPKEGCTETLKGCCKNGQCHQAEIQCSVGYIPKSLGCDNDCKQIVTCVKEPVCGNNICETGEANYLYCSDLPSLSRCYSEQGTCPQDCDCVEGHLGYLNVEGLNKYNEKKCVEELK